MRKNIFFTLFLCCFLMVPLKASAQNSELVIFSSRKEPLIKPIIDLFTSKTGITVILKTGKSAALSQQILQELPNPSADVYIAKESGSLEYLRMNGALDSYNSDSVASVPEKFRARDWTWVGVSGRSRAVIYNKDLIKENDVPKTLNALTDQKYKGKIAAVNSGNESFIAWISALRIKMGDSKVETFLTKLKANDIVLVSKSHTDIRKAVGRGEYPLGLINHYYYHLQRNEKDAALTNVGIVYLDQAKGARGEIVNVSGAGIVKGTKNREAAEKFLDFLTSIDAQKLFAEVNFEYPLRAGVSSHSEVLESIGCVGASAVECLNVMDVRLDELGPAMEGTLEMLDRVSWY